jgi:hypothetical protein
MLAGVPLTVAPSATIWHRCTTTPAGDDRPVVLCAGPDLPDAEKEVVELAGIYPEALALTGPDACVEQLLRALDGAGLGHIAAHGRFRSDNVLFSSLRVHDGELTATLGAQQILSAFGFGRSPWPTWACPRSRPATS